jgi:glycine hydroxymethyltransferase
MHVIAGKAVAFLEALQPDFKAYQQQVVVNARVMAETLAQRGVRIISGRTESHVFLVDLRPKGLTGKAADAFLGQAHITVNKNAIPNDPESPFVTSGIRIGSPAVTTRGFKEAEAVQVANLIADVLDNPENSAVIEATKQKVHALTAQFPVYGA